MSRVLRRSSTVFVLTAVLLLSLVATTSAARQDHGVRAYGMGSAFTAVANDLSALIHNPAGLSQTAFELYLSIGSKNLTNALKLQSLIEDPFDFKDEDVTLNLATLTGVSIGRFGAGLVADGHLIGTTDCAADFCAEGGYMTRIVGGVALKPPLLPKSFETGVSIQRLDGRRVSYQLTETATGYDVDMDNFSGQGFGFGLGVLWKAVPMIDLGLSVDNLFTSVEWKGTRTQTQLDSDGKEVGTPTTTTLAPQKESFQPTYRVGVAIRPPIFGTILAADVGSDGSVSFGAETNLLFNAISLRAGQMRIADETTTTVGVGAHLGPLRVDIGVGTHDFKEYGFNISGSVRF